MITEFKNAILDIQASDLQGGAWPEALKISEQGALSTWYAPFEHVNPSAKIVLVGITPGEQQARNALLAAKQALRDGADDHEALERAKVHASFSGPMRKNLVDLLDHIGMNKKLEIETCASLWEDSDHLVHFMSALRYPVFVNGKNYSGNPSIVNTSYLHEQVVKWAGAELSSLKGAWIVPLGSAATEACDWLVAAGNLKEERLLRGLPHPSGANIERIKYFLLLKERALLSSRVNPDAIDEARRSLSEKLGLPGPKLIPA